MSVPTPFIVFALPRSRTAWLSQFLSYGPWVCGHDEIRHLRSLEDVKSWFMQPFIGTVETAGAPWWRLLERYAPDCRVLTIRRNPLEVLESTVKLGLEVDRPVLLNSLRRMDAKLDQIEARIPRTVSIGFDELKELAGCKRVFEHCLGFPFDERWWQNWHPINVQVNFGAILRYRVTYSAQLLRLGLEARHAMMADLIAKPPKGGVLEIQEESFKTVFKDGKKLFEDHCVAIGEAPDEWTRNNLPVMEMMDEMGLLQFMTARANGRMFGYLVSMVGTPLGEANGKSATHTLFYAAKEWPGVGLKLQRAALARLKEKGVDTVYMRSGMGPGARVETMYKWMGAEPEGKLFKVRLG